MEKELEFAKLVDGVSNGESGVDFGVRVFTCWCCEGFTVFLFR